MCGVLLALQVRIPAQAFTTSHVYILCHLLVVISLLLEGVETLRQVYSEVVWTRERTGKQNNSLDSVKLEDLWVYLKEMRLEIKKKNFI